MNEDIQELTDIILGFGEEKFKYRWDELELYHRFGLKILWFIDHFKKSEEEVLEYVSIKAKTELETIKDYVALVRKWPNLNESKLDKGTTWIKVQKDLRAERQEKDKKRAMTVARIKKLLDERFKDNIDAGLDERAFEDESVIKIIKEENTDDMGRT
jgi:hypothetical protein